jgi:EmrB/QacA subfamily drug resistance transporter
MAVDNTESLARRPWLALGAISLAVSLIIMDATVVNVALPSIIEDLRLNASEAEWMNAIYSLVFAALLLTLGKIGDLHGRRRLLFIGMAVFVAASIAAGASQNASEIIAARLIQGVGAAMILPATLSALNAIFTGRKRQIAFALWGATIGGMAAIGPLVGGWLTTDYTWRWAFLLNIPVGIVVIIGVVLYVPETKDESTAPGLDIGGVILSALGLGGIVFGLIEGQRLGWIHNDEHGLSPVPFVVAIGAACMVAFFWTQARRARNNQTRLIDLKLFSIRSFRYGAIAALVVALGEFGLLFTLPLLLQNALGYSALDTGWLITALALGTFLISGMTPRLTERFGARAIVRSGLLVEALAVGALALSLSPHVSTWVIASCLFMYGVGVGQATAQLTSVILHDVPIDESGQASGVQSTVRQLGSALGVAILGSLLIGTLAYSTTAKLEAEHLPDGQVSAITDAVKGSAGSVIPSLQHNPATSDAGDAASDALITASKLTTGVASIVIALGLLATLALPKIASEKRNETQHEDAA